MPKSSRGRRAGCPLCGRAPDATHKPFCSQGCRDRDLLRWLGEGYRVPGLPVEGEESEFGADGVDSDGDTPL